MKKQTLHVSLPICVAILVAGAWVANAGDINPPVGPVAPTMKTLDEVEPRAPVSTLPFTISQSGSYYLTQNLIGSSGLDGITIAADDVTLDLNGFSLIGVAGSLDGVSVPAARTNLSIRNGTIRDWGQAGIDALDATNGQFKDLRVSNNGSSGSFDGMVVGPNSSVVNCMALSNGRRGIRGGGSGCTIEGCTARQNIAGGFSLTNRSGTITNCVAILNGGDGIYVADGAVVSACSAISNSGDGIVGNGSSTILNCTVSTNTGNGIDGSSRSTIRGCNVYNNDGDGILVQQESYVVNNNCILNGYAWGADSAGVHAVLSRNRIEGNNVVGNDRGIDVDFSGNIILKNTARGSTGTGSPSANYDIAAGNSYGPIANVSGVGDISTTPNANHPWANFSY